MFVSTRMLCGTLIYLCALVSTQILCQSRWANRRLTCLRFEVSVYLRTLRGATNRKSHGCHGRQAGDGDAHWEGGQVTWIQTARLFARRIDHARSLTALQFGSISYAPHCQHVDGIFRFLSHSVSSIGCQASILVNTSYVAFAMG